MGVARGMIAYLSTRKINSIGEQFLGKTGMKLSAKHLEPDSRSTSIRPCTTLLKQNKEPDGWRNQHS